MGAAGDPLFQPDAGLRDRLRAGDADGIEAFRTGDAGDDLLEGAAGRFVQKSRSA